MKRDHFIAKILVFTFDSFEGVHFFNHLKWHDKIYISDHEKFKSSPRNEPSSLEVEHLLVSRNMLTINPEVLHLHRHYVPSIKVPPSWMKPILTSTSNWYMNVGYDGPMVLHRPQLLTRKKYGEEWKITVSKPWKVDEAFVHQKEGYSGCSCNSHHEVTFRWLENKKMKN